jgi:hypothetical protein
MAKQLQFKEVALFAQETAAAEDKGKSQAILFECCRNSRADNLRQ